MDKYEVKVEDNHLILGVDLNEDGDKLLKAKLNINEAISEAIKKGEAVEGVKVVDFKFEMTKLILKVDSDKDGEHLLEIEIDLAEALDESGIMK